MSTCELEDKIEKFPSNCCISTRGEEFQYQNVHLALPDSVYDIFKDSNQYKIKRCASNIVLIYHQILGVYFQFCQVLSTAYNSKPISEMHGQCYFKGITLSWPCTNKFLELTILQEI